MRGRTREVRPGNLQKENTAGVLQRASMWFPLQNTKTFLDIQLPDPWLWFLCPSTSRNRPALIHKTLSVPRFTWRLVCFSFSPCIRFSISGPKPLGNINSTHVPTSRSPPGPQNTTDCPLTEPNDTNSRVRLDPPPSHSRYVPTQSPIDSRRPLWSPPAPKPVHFHRWPKG